MRPGSIRLIWEHTFVTHPAYIREKARQMRIEKDLTIDEIAERLAISRQTIFSWVKDIPLRERKSNPGQALGNAAMQAKYKALRDAAYEQGWSEYAELAQEPTFRDFVGMYLAEGYKRDRNTVSICNSDMDVIYLAESWIRRFSRNRIEHGLQFHADQDPDVLRRRWADLLDVEPASIRLQRKSNSNQMTKRTWRSRHGVLTIRVGDTYFHARLQAWMRRLADEWLDLPLRGA